MKNYGIELEFFVFNGDNLIPAYTVTSSLDGNPFIGEIKTDVFSSPIDVIFDLRKKIYLEEQKLLKKGCTMSLIPEVKVGDELLKSLRKSKEYINKKDLEVLEEFSVYNKSTGKILPKGVYKASLQVNISDNEEIIHSYIADGDKQKKEFKKTICNVFDFYKSIKALDDVFAVEISTTRRVKGVYAIKSGLLGKRIEYRSLPNNINLDTLLNNLK